MKNCKVRNTRNGCNLPMVRIRGDSCKTARGGTPTVKSPQYKLTVTNNSINADKPVDISAI